MRKDPKVGGRVGGTCKVTKDKTQHSPRTRNEIGSLEMALLTLFGKLQEHEMKLGRLSLHGELDKRKKDISLMASTSIILDEIVDEDSDSDLDYETMTLLNSTLKGKTPKERFTSHECEQLGHMKFQCPTYLKKVENDKKTSRDFKSKKAYIIWDVPKEKSTSSTSEKKNTGRLFPYCPVPFSAIHFSFSPNFNTVIDI
ncbi:hypothetical protein Lal_00027016 [Lupinus albus]|nr:hypothetical protein Lal_00027016 [Lupinus albus]